MTEAISALLNAVLDAPDDIASRRVYADALADAGDPRGDFINVQCDLADCAVDDPRFPELCAREGELLAAHRKTWIAPHKPFLFRPQFVRGMIEDAFVNTKKFLPNAATLLEHEPVTSLGMRALTRSGAATLGARPEMSRLTALRVAESTLGAPGVAKLFSTRMSRLRRLNLYQAGIDDDAIDHLGDTVFPHLERLDLSGNPISWQRLETLLHDQRLQQLRYLALKWAAPGNAGAAGVAHHLDLPSLTHLDLGCSHYTADAITQLARGKAIHKLRGLRLEQNDLTGAAIDALAPLEHLEVLDLSTNPIGYDGCDALAESKFPLRVLRLYQTQLDDPNAVRLANGNFPNLRYLDLGYARIGPLGMQALTLAEWPLEKLELWAVKIQDRGIEAIARSSWTKTLRELVIGFTGITDTGVAALAAASWPKLERIVFRGDSVGEAGARAIGSTTTMPALRSLTFEGMGLPKRPLAPLRKRGVALELS